jgi:F-type H+-transporting ATPase subunit gamma
MANLKEIRNRITSVDSTMKITSAMKMVSAAKLKRAQDAITQMRPYAEKLQEILSNVSSTLDASEGVYSQVREEKNVLFVAITSNRGLCGGFNNNVIKRVNALSSEHSNSKITIVPIGKKARDAYKNSNKLYAGTTIPKGLEELWEEMNFTNVSGVAQKIMDAFTSGEFDKVILVYNKFKNAATQEIQAEQFLPILPPSEKSTTSLTDYIFEPSKEVIVNDLIPKSLKVQVYKAMLDSQAAEHGARMTAMHKATDNANELKKELKLFYNKARQAAITNEILEIVAGAEALNG